MAIREKVLTRENTEMDEAQKSDTPETRSKTVERDSRNEEKMEEK